jgi:hypothetical protein
VIVVRQKHVDDILEMVGRHKRVLILGCNTCSAVALAGGEKEVETLAELLRLATSRRGSQVEFEGTVLQRQCEPEFIEELEGLDAGDFDAFLSLGCGAGVALLSENEDVPVYPAVDTLFIGAARGLANWQAECSACGECVLGETAGICPITRCAKGIMNGPCGGVSDGECELGDRECAWVQIHERLEALDQNECITVTQDPKDHSAKTLVCEWDMSEPGDGK